MNYVREIRFGVDIVKGDIMSKLATGRMALVAIVVGSLGRVFLRTDRDVIQPKDVEALKMKSMERSILVVRGGRPYAR